MTTELTIDEYESTLTERMINVTGIETPVAETWSYIQQLVTEQVVPQHVFTNQLVEIMYRNENNTFDHLLLPTNNPDVFIVIIIDLLQKLIKGHYRQDLNEVYGLT